MGLLDDAIRDHLELMRRHGADPAELERLERDALGPVRRPGAEPYEQALEEGDAEAIGQAGSHLPGQASEWAEVRSLDDVADEELEVEEAPLQEAEDGEVGQLGAGPEEPDVSRDRLGAGDTSEAATAELAPADAGLGETEEYDVEAALQAERERAARAQPELPAAGQPGAAAGEQADTPGDEDLLEETPEFLQDAPDHDRLWFEQRPPRDFDFGG